MEILPRLCYNEKNEKLHICVKGGSLVKFVFASDSFKGSLSSEQIARLLAQAARETFPDCETVCVPVADGGEGTVDAVSAAAGGSLRTVSVSGPLGGKVAAAYAVLPGQRAVIEMAAASGLPLVPDSLRNPMKSTTFGTGQLMLDALEQGCREISLAIGGSATNDGGMGALAALGARFFDGNGIPLPGTGDSLGKVASADLSGLDKRLRYCRLTVMCDVTNPLTGPNGAAYTFAAQKGADAAMQQQLEDGMTRYAAVLERETGRRCAEAPGSGAAGGLGFGLMAALGAVRQSGIEAVLDLIGFDRLLEGADLVVTGEGRMDWQSAHGKAPAGIGERCARAGVPAIALVGGLGPGYEEIYRHGIVSVLSTAPGPLSLEEAISRAEPLYLDAARRMFRLLGLGMMRENP